MKVSFKYRLSVIWYYIKCFIAIVIYTIPTLSLFISYILWGGAMFPKDPRDIHDNLYNGSAEDDYDEY